MEIEMKVPFGTDRVIDIINKVKNDPKYVEDKFLKKVDSFYTNKTDAEASRNAAAKKGGVVVRIREEGDLPKNSVMHILLENRQFPSLRKSTTFTTKIKTVVDGYESNVENETNVDNYQEMSKCLYNMGYRVWFNKVKYSYGVYTKVNGKTYHVEIERVMNEVNGRSVLYVEIENTQFERIPDSFNKESIIADEKSIFEDLGLLPGNSDNRPWVEILK